MPNHIMNLFKKAQWSGRAGKQRTSKRHETSTASLSSGSGSGSGSVSGSVSGAANQLSSQQLSIILAHVCQHALDDSIKSSEESLPSDGCMLCEMRDLAHCALVSRKWCTAAQLLLYRNVRIEAVHYCELEIALSSHRKRQRSFVDGTELDAPQARLQLFMRTVRESQHLADIVRSLRLPYMTREASKADLARAVSVLRNLHYVDLPLGFFSDEPSSYTLKQELMAQCPNIRRMAYAHGSEMGFSSIPGSKLWVNLQNLELSSLLVEEGTLRQAVGSFPALRSLKMDSLPSIGDSIFSPTPSLPMLPALTCLDIRNMPAITVSGLATYLSTSRHQNALETLVLAESGVRPELLHEILSLAPRLKHVTLESEIERFLPAGEVPSLASKSVTTMHYEVTTKGSSSETQSVARSYYNYLMTSLISNCLPALRSLYVLNPRFPDMLRLTPPANVLDKDDGRRMSAPILRPSLQQPLTLYTKGRDEFEWNITQYDPLSLGQRTSTTRPMSLHSAHLSAQWGGGRRQSVMVGNGFGGFIAVPTDNQWPSTGGEAQSANRRDSQYDLWR